MKQHAAAGEAQAFVSKAMCWRDDACLLWPYATTKKGLPIVGHCGSAISARRLVCASVNGAAPTASDAVTACENSLCLAPRHLKWATLPTISARKRVAGTQPHGIGIHTAKLNPELVALIKAAAGSNRGLSVKYGVAPNTIRAVRLGRSWQCL